jgi:hypothetical protein
MRGFSSGIDAKGWYLCALLMGATAVFGQNTPPPHVVIPNPTPRPPDLQQELGNSPTDQKKREAISLESQLRAREVWLESNQILLLAQQLEQEIVSGKKQTSMAVKAAKVAKIEKLAQTVQEKMKMQ